MEEVMASLLMDTLTAGIPALRVAEEKRARLRDLVSSVQQDTLSHKKVVSELIERFTREQGSDAV